MSKINLLRLVSSVIGSAACSFAVLFFVGCDLGTYSERVQSTGGTLPMAGVSQPGDLGSAKASDANSDSKTDRSNGRDSDSRDSAQKSKRDDPGKKKATSLADIKEKTDARRAQQEEAEGRARAAGGN